ncbi:3-hydroxyacyl-ACP dehydratase [Chryseobacterium sp.]|uniref:3-hydroxyacyl-ACP dehydratase n=1 Tax=Chryseobacterium sp. TaxID=1871047 RepID=UPI0011C9FC19|nr:3-hydroxyacyl-ACP dehydratase [Chryseobacterium sp.]TXF75869.1 3-hydroxyacyl-ACP dehydratase [Chryseobacterium sp.]
MAALKDFYTVKSTEKTETGIFLVHVFLNKNHEIYKGHFPENPVVPGVCMLQMVKELTEEILQKKLFFTSASNVKFISFINPELTPGLVLTLDISEDEEIKVKSTASFGQTIALKMSVKYKIQ